MSVGLYFDHHIPDEIARALRTRGVDVQTAHEDGMSTAGDEALLRRTTELGRLLVSRDADFRRIAAARQRAGTGFRSVVSVRGDLMNLGPIIDALYLVAEGSRPGDWEDQVIYVPF